MKTSSCIISSLLVMLLSQALYAQDSTLTVAKSKYIHFGMSPGYLHTDFEKINASLSTYGFKPMKEDFATFSFSLNLLLNRVLLTDELTLLIPNSVRQPGEIITTFSGYNIGVGIGYAVIQKEKFRLYPYVGFNAFTTRLRIDDNASVENMNDIINTPNRNATITFSTASFDVGLQLEKVIALPNREWDCPQNSRLMTLGARIGYNFGPTVKGKYNGNQPIADAPSYALKGPYVKLIVGFGSQLRQLKWNK